ncbi:hypothetical protein [Roseicella aerolata]|uniref:Uncharacterized protein n=1 Tax=Roseicella aerolata TaxID=2883479 RepID=A0A9X1IJL8_9PROT|nr:hypothetical protein [Roseicella aerolata]MCB4825361.1 hypothetical protein [Roseicella aerolata]
MAVLATGEQARRSRRSIVSNGVSAHLTTFIGSNRYLADGDAQQLPRPEEVYPMAFLVEQPPGSVVQAHFHESNQFQIVVAGSGVLGRHMLRPIAVHYSNAYSSYGPIAAGEEGLQYLTLRNGYDRGARYLPAAREALKGVRRRYREAVAEPVLAGGPVPEAAIAEALLPEAPDGLGAWRHRLPPDAMLRGPDPATGDGQFWVVTAGAIHTPDGACLPALSCGFVGPEETPFVVMAGKAGLEVVVVQYPRGRDHLPPSI